MQCRLAGGFHYTSVLLLLLHCSSTACGTQHQLLHVPRLLPKPNSPTLTLWLTPFATISTPHNHHSSLTSAAEASPQSYYWGGRICEIRTTTSTPSPSPNTRHTRVSRPLQTKYSNKIRHKFNICHICDQRLFKPRCKFRSNTRTEAHIQNSTVAST